MSFIVHSKIGATPLKVSSISKKEYYRKWKEEGRCVNCTLQPPLPDRTKCKKCSERTNAEYQKRKAGRIASQKCVKCSTRKPKRGCISCGHCIKRDFRNYKARQADYQRVREISFKAKWKEPVYQAYGGYRCNCCGQEGEKFLTIDHVNNDGTEHRKEIGKSSWHLFKWLTRNNFPPGFQVLCWNCNMGKRVNRGTCPHKGAK